MATFGSHPLHKTIDHLFLAGFFERDGELVAVDLHHLAIAEFLVKHAIMKRKFRNGAGGFRDQLALDGDRAALVAGRAAMRIAARGGKGRLAFIKAAAGLSLPFVLSFILLSARVCLATRAIGLRPLPARRRIA